MKGISRSVSDPLPSSLVRLMNGILKSLILPLLAMDENISITKKPKSSNHKFWKSWYISVNFNNFTNFFNFALPFYILLF